MLSNFGQGKDPTNIGYMCLKMKEKFISQLRLKSQRNAVKQLDHKFTRNRRENSMQMYQDEYHLKSLLQKQKKGELTADVPLCNGGYIRKYSLMQNNPGFRFSGGDELIMNEVSSLEQYNRMTSEERARVLNKIAVTSGAATTGD